MFRTVFPRTLKLLVWAASGIVLTACQQSSLPDPASTPTRTPTILLMGYRTPTPSLTPSPFPTPVVLPVTPAPSPTPFTHLIAKGDTLLGIALKYGIPQEDILAANPGIDPQFLKVGEGLVVPLSGEDYAPFATPTPFPLPARAPVCYQSTGGSALCIFLVENDQAEALENLTGWIALAGPNGDILAGEEALPLLNLLPPGAGMPLVAQFPPPLPEWYNLQGGLLSALPVPENDMRYLDAGVDDLLVEINPDKKQARVAGEVVILDKVLPARVWVAAVAYGPDGEVVGIRKLGVGEGCLVQDSLETEGQLESENSSAEAGGSGDEETASPEGVSLAEGCLVFEFVVYSAGPEIERVDILVEARP